MIRCIAIDDSPNALEVIRLHAERVPLLDLVATFRSPVKALEFLREERVDLIFLDISMPEMIGTDFARALPGDIEVIFTTAYPEYAVEGFELDAVDYLCKPIELDRFVKAVDKVEGAGHISVKSGTSTHRVKVREILYVKSEGSYVRFVTGERSILTLMTMRKARELLPPPRFIQIHRSFTIAREHVGTVETDAVRIGKTRIPIGKTFRDRIPSLRGRRGGSPR